MSDFILDGSGIKDPIDFAFEELHTPFKDATGTVVVSAYRSAIARFNALTSAQYDAWCSAADGLPHTVTVYPHNSNTPTAYSNVFIERLRAEYSTGVYVYNAEFRVYHISTLAAFGA